MRDIFFWVSVSACVGALASQPPPQIDHLSSTPLRPLDNKGSACFVVVDCNPVEPCFQEASDKWMQELRTVSSKRVEKTKFEEMKTNWVNLNDNAYATRKQAKEALFNSGLDFVPFFYKALQESKGKPEPTNALLQIQRDWQRKGVSGQFPKMHEPDTASVRKTIETWVTDQLNQKSIRLDRSDRPKVFQTIKIDRQSLEKSLGCGGRPPSRLFVRHGIRGPQKPDEVFRVPDHVKICTKSDVNYAVMEFSDSVAVSIPISDLSTEISASQNRLHKRITEEFPLEDNVCQFSEEGIFR